MEESFDNINRIITEMGGRATLKHASNTISTRTQIPPQNFSAPPPPPQNHPTPPIAVPDFNDPAVIAQLGAMFQDPAMMNMCQNAMGSMMNSIDLNKMNQMTEAEASSYAMTQFGKQYGMTDAQIQASQGMVKQIIDQPAMKQTIASLSEITESTNIRVLTDEERSQMTPEQIAAYDQANINEAIRVVSAKCTDPQIGSMLCNNIAKLGENIQQSGGISSANVNPADREAVKQIATNFQQVYAQSQLSQLKQELSQLQSQQPSVQYTSSPQFSDVQITSHIQQNALDPEEWCPSQSIPHLSRVDDVPRIYYTPEQQRPGFDVD